ncbi:cleavage and polyadenylation specificity factor subunit 5 [Dermatophagoides farinae]|uniref:cleavage and polyadenylation specificity factor subunit 5 n=1 Tax=Dermatophagoides farinae TaxID=6954 RepID=UPI003F5EC5AB
MPSLESTLNIYPLKNYSFITKNDYMENKDPSLPGYFNRLRREFKYLGQRTTVKTVLLVHDNNMINVLLLRMAPQFYLLPGGQIQPNECEEDALKRYLFDYFGLDIDTQTKPIDVIAHWWRPNFEQNQYPYIPAHISQPKELTRIYLMSLNERATLSVPKNYTVVATPLFELYNNVGIYGEIMASLPQVLSRFNFNIIT